MILANWLVLLIIWILRCDVRVCLLMHHICLNIKSFRLRAHEVLVFCWHRILLRFFAFLPLCRLLHRIVELLLLNLDLILISGILALCLLGSFQTLLLLGVRKYRKKLFLWLQWLGWVLVVLSVFIQKMKLLIQNYLLWYGYLAHTVLVFFLELRIALKHGLKELFITVRLLNFGRFTILLRNMEIEIGRNRH